MNFTYFIRLLIKRWIWLLLLPIIASVAIYMKTKKSTKTYMSTMTIYTGITSGVSIDAQTTMIDYSQALIAYDNLLNVMKSEKTLDNVGLRLFCKVMMSGGKSDKVISSQYYTFLINSVPAEVKKLINPKSDTETYNKCRDFMNKNDDNYIYNLIHKSGTNFGIGSLSGISVKRLNTSDLIEVSYQANDPGICYQTLLILFEETRANFQALKSEQSTEVLKYFESQKNEVKTVLDQQEQSLLTFSKENKIINYDEQSRLIVSQKFGVEDKMDNLNMAIEGAGKSIQELEKKLGVQNKLRLKSDQIVSIRNQIAKLSAEHAAQSFYTSDTATISATYERKLNLLKSDFRAAIDSMHLIQNTQEGVTVESILSQWLNNVVAYDQAKAQMPIIERRTQAINQMFDQYSPLGADVKRQEREIAVSEQQYLSVLSGLHSAKLKDQSSKMAAGSISVLDQPTFPTSFLPDKSSLRATIAFLAVFLLLLVLIILIEFVDTTISNVARAERFSGLTVGFLFPLISAKKKKVAVENFDEVASNYLALELLRVIKVNADTVAVNLISVYAQEGKTFIKERLEKAFQNIDEKSGTNFNELIKINEFPAISNQYFDENEIEKGVINILVCRANRGWKPVDTRIINLFEEQTGTKPTILLNGVGVQALENQWANIPIKRNKLVTLFNKLLSLEFTVKDKF